MKISNIVRIVGSLFVVLGLGSAYMRTQMDTDTVLTAWMGSAQPWSGAAMAVVGVVLWVVSKSLRQRTPVEA